MGRQVDIDFGSGGRFRVGVSELLRMKAGFEEVLFMVQQADGMARQTAADQTPPGQDPYSEQAVKAICKLASSDIGCHGHANQAFQQEIQKVIDLLQATFDQYATTEDRRRATFSQNKD